MEKRKPMENINKQTMYEVVLYLLNEVEDKKKTLNALKELLSTTIAEEESIQLTINSIYQRYLRDTDIYTAIFKQLNLAMESVETPQEEVKEKPTKTEIENKKKQIDLQEEIEEEEKTIEEEAEEHEVQKFRDKMKDTNKDSILSRLNLLQK